ncbi:unnamed protein product [Ambrosiozyma monospora]|uniref:Unnamed protein product n=1 Tax=Ambrosiozyma monospora TaxID=43982 RepID=A0A9W6Z3A5_AMBMO|nr:unnamed protein product [Ambrosiozyma monospora]
MNTVQQPADSLDSEYINEEHILSFEEAINYDDTQQQNSDDFYSLLSPTTSVYGLPLKSRSNSTQKLNGSTSGTGTQTPGNVELISSQNDWAPVYNRTSKTEPDKQGKNKNKNKKKKKTKKSTSSALIDEHSMSLKILRYPILAFIFGWIAFLSFAYLFIRLGVALSERISVQTDSKKRHLIKELDNAKNYNDYVSKAKELDEYLGLKDWCSEDRYSYYDWKTLRRIVRQLRKLRTEKKFDELKIVLQSCVKSNFAGTENPLLYSHCYYGTKRLVEVYNHEVCSSLQSIIDTDAISFSEKRTFFKVVTRNFGKTALALSGGASFTYLHYGVMKALLETDLMPKIISGTSGGGLCSALATTRTNEELLKLLTPKLAKNINACGDDPWYVWMYRWWRTGARFDPLDWARKVQWWTMGSMTFQECYERTGKTLNISTVPHDIHSPTILCNYLTSPNCCIWSTLLASAAVPGILPPVVLMEKSAGDSIIPFSFGNRFKDGSMRTDIPIEALNTHFNVKFSIVSQVNPHVLLWFFKNKGDIGTPLSLRLVKCVFTKIQRYHHFISKDFIEGLSLHIM